jgi:hypothetical protein
MKIGGLRATKRIIMEFIRIAMFTKTVFRHSSALIKNFELRTHDI